MKVIFSDRAFAAVLAETTEKITTETGGLFLGVVKGDTWYIVEAIDPGPKSIFEIAYFEYDQKYTEHLINKIANLYSHKLDLIGLWHRHPGSFDIFSSTDDGTNSKYASMRKEGAISGLVNIDPVFRFTMYHVAQPCKYSKISYTVGDDLIPDEYLAYKTPDRFYALMEKRSKPESARQNNPQYKTTVSLESFLRFILPYAQKCELTDDGIEDKEKTDNTEELAEAILDDLTFMTEKVGIQVALCLQDQGLEISQEAIDKTTKLCFMPAGKDKQIVFSYNGEYYQYQSGLFEQLAKQAKEDKDKQISGAGSEQKPKRSGGIFDSMFKFFGKGEDNSNGDKDS